MTVWEMIEAARQRVEAEVTVCGTVKGLNLSAARHLYFDLLDGRSRVRCLMYRGLVARVAKDVADGDRVTVTGILTLYTVKGDLQLVVTELYPTVK